MSRYVRREPGFLRQGGYPVSDSVRDPDNAWYVRDWENESRARRWATNVARLAVAVLGLWVVGTTGYIIFYDDLVKTGFAERVQMQAAYEDRISRLRTQVDTINGRLMLNQDAFDAKLESLRQRQAMLEQHQTRLAELMRNARNPALAAVSGDTAAPNAELASAATPNETTAAPATGHRIQLTFAPRAHAATGSRPLSVALADPNVPPAARSASEQALTRLAESQDALETAQHATLNTLEARATAASSLIVQTMTDLGFGVLAKAPPLRSAPLLAYASPVGGPFVPMPLDAESKGSSFERQIARINSELSRTNGLYDTFLTLPVHPPVDGAVQITSSFGPRNDPFLGSMAMHSGVDIRGASGVSVLATADGVVTYAQRYAGYGNMVDIEHKNGLTTRYAHLSSITVTEGRAVKAGDVIGGIGSTGRSTGPHLHYEARLGDEPIDPIEFVRAGARIMTGTEVTAPH